MQRRALLKAAPVALVGVTGCVSTLQGVLPGDDLPDYVDVEFTHFQPGTTGYERAPDVGDPPSVEFAENGGHVTVRGKLFVGSSTCDRAGMERISYDEASRTLSVTVGSVSRDTDRNACTGDESADAYRLVVTFDQNEAERVEVEEVDGRSGKSTVAKP
jgi:hypothetical protein